jgi:hypothetical protein
LSFTSFERANIVAGQSKITSEKIILGKKHKHFYNLRYIEIPELVARKFELKDSDCLIWRYFHDKRAAIVTKREGWKSANERILKEKAKKQTPTYIN